MDVSLLVNGEEARPAQKLRIALPIANEIPQGMKLGAFALVPAQI